MNIRLISGNDSLYSTTDNQGEYRFDQLNTGFFYLTYSMLGYKTLAKSHFVLDRNKKTTLPLVRLESVVNLIPQVDVVYVLPIVLNGDTTQFNFEAFNFRKHSLLEEALKELPGFQVYRDGSVTFNGRLISKVRVDNKEFFGGDLLTATRNLPSDFIKNIQVLNASASNEESVGIGNDDGEKMMNITLKEDSRKFIFGQGTVGMGTDDRYLGSFGLNKFDKGQEISVLGSFNNTNTSVFAFGNPMGGDRTRSTIVEDSFADPIDGLRKVGSLGVNISDQLSDRISFNASYNYLFQKNFTEGESQLTSVYTNNTIHRKDDYKINTTDKNHRVRFGLDIKLKNNDILKVNGNLSYNQQDVEQVKELVLRNSNTSSEGNNQDSSRRDSPIGDVELLYSKHFAKKGRKLVANINVNSNNLNRTETVNERYWEYNLNDLDNYINNYRQQHYISQRNQTNAGRASVFYIEPFTDKALFEFAYEYEGTAINALRLVEDRLLQEEYKYIDSLMVNYNYLYSSHKGSMTFQYEPNKKVKMNVGFAVQPLLLTGKLPREDISYNYDIVNLIPTASLMYKFSNEMDWQISYKGKNNQPYFNQIAPVTDNTNSKNIIIGNPELKAEYLHRVSSAFRKIGSRMQYFETNVAFNYILNKIVSDKRTLPSTNIQETTFKNTSGYYEWKWYYTFNTPFITEDITLDLTGTADYFNNLSYIDNRKRTTKQVLLNQSLQFRYNLSDYFETALHANYSWNQARYDIPYRTNIDVETLFLGLSSKGYLNDHWALGFETSQQYNGGYKNSILNVNQTIMNSYIEFTFMKNRSALLRLQAYDIFDQNKNAGIVSEYIGNDVFEARNNRLGRYFMLSLNLRLQKLPKKDS